MAQHRRPSRERNIGGAGDQAPAYLVRFDGAEGIGGMGGPRRQEIEWFRALEAERLDALQSLLMLGFNPNTEGKDKSTALQASIRKNNIRMLELLLQYKVNITSHIGLNNETPLSFAARYGRHECVKMMCQIGGIDPDTPDFSGGTALMYAAQFGQIAVMKVLVELNANVNRKDNRGDCALSVAAYHGRLESIRFLVDKGANLETVDLSGNTPIQAALDGGHLECADFLRTKLAGFVSDKVWVAAKENDTSQLTSLLKSGRHPDDLGVRGNKQTALIWACQHGHAEAVQILLQYGANIEAVGLKQNWTPLLYSIESNVGACALMLLAAGANPHVLSSNGDTALHIAARVENFAVVESLISKGLLPEQRNHIGETPLSIANSQRRQKGINTTNFFHPKYSWIRFASMAHVLNRYFSKSHRFHGRYRLKDVASLHYGQIFEYTTDLQQSRACVLKFLDNFDEFQRQIKLHENPACNKNLCLMLESFVDDSIHESHPYCIALSVGEETLLDRQDRILLDADEVQHLSTSMLQFCVTLSKEGLGIVHFTADMIYRFWDGTYRLLASDAILEMNSPIPESVFRMIRSNGKAAGSIRRNADVNACRIAFGIFFQDLSKQSILSTVHMGTDIAEINGTREGELEETIDVDEECYLLGVACKMVLEQILSESSGKYSKMEDLQDIPFFQTSVNTCLAPAGNIPPEMEAFLTSLKPHVNFDRPRLFVLSPSTHYNWTIPMTWSTWISSIERGNFMDIHFLCEETLHTVNTEAGFQVKESRSFWSSILLLAGLILFWTKQNSPHVPFVTDEVLPKASVHAEDIKRVILLEFPELADLVDDRPYAEDNLHILGRKAIDAVARLDNLMDRLAPVRKNSGLFPVDGPNGVRWLCIDHAKRAVQKLDHHIVEAQTSAKDFLDKVKVDLENQYSQVEQEEKDLSGEHSLELTRLDDTVEKTKVALGIEIERLRELERKKAELEENLSQQQRIHDELQGQIEEMKSVKTELQDKSQELEKIAQETDQKTEQKALLKSKIISLEKKIEKQSRAIEDINEKITNFQALPPQDKETKEKCVLS